MKFLKIILSLAMVWVVCSCQPKPQGDESVPGTPGDAFVPSPGMKLGPLADLPGVVWEFDTIRGVCAPDTFLLWMHYDGADYATNVIGSADKFDFLNDSGIKKALESRGTLGLARNDFLTQASIASIQLLARDEFRQIADSLYRQRVDSMVQAAKNFYLSGGETQYMARGMAANWQLIYDQSEKVDDDMANPFNRGPSFEFETESLSVQVADAQEGVVEVTAYCWDPYTVGRPGWAYWTVKMTIEGGRFRVKETPAQHRRFTTG